MTRLSTVKDKAVDAFSAVFLLFAILLAGGLGSVAETLSPNAMSPKASNAGSGSHPGYPSISKQQYVLSEAKDAKASTWDDGKPKHYVAAAGIALVFQSGTCVHGPQGVFRQLPTACSPFDARAPPAFS